MLNENTENLLAGIEPLKMKIKTITDLLENPVSGKTSKQISNNPSLISRGDNS